MNILFLIFFGSFICALILGVICFIYYGKTSKRTQVCFVIIASLIASYGFSLVQLCLYPYFIDNGSNEFIDWPYRWTWAAIEAGLFQFIVIPVGLACYVFYIRRIKSNEAHPSGERR